MTMLMYLAKVARIEFVHAYQDRTTNMSIIPMTTPEKVCAILIIAKVFQSIQPEQLTTTFGHGELNLRLAPAILAMTMT